MLKWEILKNLLIELYSDSDDPPKTLFEIYSKAAKECNCDVSRIYYFCRPKYIYQSPINREIAFFTMKKRLRDISAEKDKEIEKLRFVLNKQIQKNIELQERIICLSDYRG